MIIGISGKKQSGKSTVGKIIQWLIYIDDIEKRQKDWPLKGNISFNSFMTIMDTNNISSWQLKSFAGKLKQCVSIITGCKVEDLENEEFKNNSLGKVWINKHKNWIYVEELNKTNTDISKLLKEGTLELIGTDLYRLTTLDRELVYRELLQKLGTDVCRNIHPDFWVNALFADYNIIDEKIILAKVRAGRPHSLPEYPNWIITDVRFLNELKAIEDRGGFVIRVNRRWIVSEDDKGNRLSIHRMNPEFLTGKPEHPSETALDNHNFKYVINNDGTIEELIEQVREILIKEKII